MPQDLINSSDIEPDQSDHEAQSNLGAKLIEKFMQSIQTDRIASIKFQKGLKFTSLAPSTDDHHTRTWTLFSSFYQNAGGRSMSQTPRSQDIERFLERCAAHTKGRSPDGLQKPSVEWFRHLIRSTLTNCVFHYADFQFTKHDRIRMNTIVTTLIKNEVLSTEPQTAKQWITVMVIRFILIRFFEYAINEGVRSWDVAWSKLASIVLQSALACRCGDILRAAGYGAHYCLEWKHIDIRFVSNTTGMDVVDLVMVIDLQFEKHDKNNKQTSRKVLFRPLPPSAENFLCPIRVLLVQAFRCKYMMYDTLEECLRNLRSRSHGLSLKFKPIAYGRPVFPAFYKGGSSLVLDQPAGHEQLTKSLRELSDIAGVTTKLRSHDNRRGAGREVALLPQSNVNISASTMSVASALGHKPKTAALGITQDYIGDSYNDEYTRRVENAFAPVQTDHLQGTFGIEVTTQGFRKRKNSSKAIDEEVRRYGHDLTNQNHRLAASKRLHELQRIEWSTEQQEKGNIRPALELRSVNARIKAPTAQQLVKPARMDTVDSQLLEKPVRTDTGDLHAQESFFNATLDPRLRSLDSMNAEADQLNESSFDEKESSVMLPIGNEELNEALFEGAVDEALVAELVDNIDKDVELVGGNANTFIMTFANYNVVLRPERRQLKDGETQLLIPCKNKAHGCDYASPKKSTLDFHEKRCIILGPDLSPATVLDQKTIPCKEASCSQRFKTRTLMTSHHWRVHQWVSKRCEEPGCSDDRVFQTRSPYEDHMRSHKVGSTWQSRRCPIEGCGTTTVYVKKRSFRAHLESVHSLFRGAVAEYMKDKL